MPPVLAWEYTELFKDIIFPEKISYGAKMATVFNTSVTETSGGFSQRISHWSEPLMQLNVSHGLKSMEDVHALLAFFRVVAGQKYSFRVKDWTDYKSSFATVVDARTVPAVTMLDQNIGTGTGALATFQLRKVYTVDAETEYRTITKPRAGTLLIAVNGVAKTNPTHYTIDARGLITFVTPPPNAHAVTAGYEFDVPCRFESDTLNAMLGEFGLVDFPDVQLREVRVYEE